MERKFHILMFPWFAMGHMTPYLQLANQLAERGHKITMFLPSNAKLRLDPSNFHPSLITLRPITVPHVDPLPPGTETAYEIPVHLTTHLATAMDLTRPEIEAAIGSTMPADFIFYDFANWVPEVAARYGIKCVCYSVIFSAATAIAFVPTRNEACPTVPPPGYPSESIIYRGPEINKVKSFRGFEFGSGITFYERITKAIASSDAIAFRTVKETEGSFCDYLSRQYNKPVFFSGPTLFGLTKDGLDLKWVEWLGRFGAGSVVFCSFGTEVVLKKDQFQELLLGFEMTNLPFLIAVKPPIGCATVDEALPEGFKERVGERGVVHGGWIQQNKILAQGSVGCFVNHCGYGSVWESLLSESQIVLVPQYGDQILTTRLLVEEFKMAVEVEKESDGWISKESLCKSIKSVMNQGSEVGDLVKKNHTKFRDVLVSPGFMSGYIDNFIKDLEKVLN